MSDRKTILLFYGLAAIFTAINLQFLSKEVYWLIAVPMIAVIGLLLFFALDKLAFLLAFIAPFSFTYAHEALGFTIDLPTEPIILLIMAIFLFRLVYDGSVDVRAAKHPIGIIILLHLVWMFVTSVSSEIPLVSFKYLLSRFWFVIVFFFAFIPMYATPGKIKKFLWFFGLGLGVVVIYATIRHAGFGFERKLGYFVVRPFFNDHTHYAAVLALIAPFFAISVFDRSYKKWLRWMAVFLFLILCMGILLSYSRAAWVSIAIAAAAAVILIMRIRFGFLLAGSILVLASLFAFQTDIVMKLQRNTQESSGDFAEHARSISNITTDASNLERINRWRSAIRMYQERPVLGWGPGTYQLVYAPFQRSEDYTIITTHFGDQGNAHSEYLGPLAESGLPGMLLFLTLAVLLLYKGVQLSKRAPDRELRMIALSITLGLTTYLTHGVLNNFLDTDKAGILFWAMAGMLVAIDMNYLNKIHYGNIKKSSDAPNHSKI